ncbi:hypothetical protein AK830_g12689 [Neonectria ditissima]|uniref:Uncharacterized protein n=1 Tax=Neonectria ditissima TaxID=78410 RepID=A0A0P7AAD4_9HYPO|nr:hypothetical protein AK830_g12689 [Neonectria ditissima]
MDDSSDSGRPLKRVKYARHRENHVLAVPEIINPADDVLDPLEAAPLFDPQWQQAGLSSPSQVLLNASEMVSSSPSPPWPTAFLGEETICQPSSPISNRIASLPTSLLSSRPVPSSLVPSYQPAFSLPL